MSIKEKKLKAYLMTIAEGAMYFPELCELKVEEWYAEITKIIEDEKTDCNTCDADNRYRIECPKCRTNCGEPEKRHKDICDCGGGSEQRRPVHREPGVRLHGVGGC